MLQAVVWIKQIIQYVIWMNLTPSEIKIKETMMSQLKSVNDMDVVNVCESIIEDKLATVDHKNMIDWIHKNPQPAISKKPPIRA